MKQEFDLKIGADGTIETIYQEGIEAFAETIGADVTRSCRVSDVEWEEWSDWEGMQGWVVRSVKDRTLAIRSETKGNITAFYCNRTDALHFFKTRKEALELEVRFFWELRNG